MNSIRLYGRYALASIRAQMQYPASFLMMLFGQFVITLVEFIGIWALFHRFGQIKGWSLGQVALFYGVINISFAIAEVISRGFDVFGADFVKTGNFDRVLLRPRGTALQILGQEVRLDRMGRLLQGAVVAIVAGRFSIEWGIGTIALLAVTIAGGVALFLGILILQATLSFWTVESLEVANILTYGGVEASQYPIDIYARWFRDFVIFVVPLACVGYFPVVQMLGRADPLGAPAWLCSITPLFGFLFLAAALQVWRIGVRHYASTGS
jgi:ABC-2 type transport system permease protein